MLTADNMECIEVGVKMENYVMIIIMITEYLLKIIENNTIIKIEYIFYYNNGDNDGVDANINIIVQI
jgi:hypothetical protein